MGSKTERVSLVKTSGIFFLHVLRKIKQTNGFFIVNYIIKMRCFVKHFLLLIVLLEIYTSLLSGTNPILSLDMQNSCIPFYYNFMSISRWSEAGMTNLVQNVK